jgi:hypothetical protein
MSLKVLYKRIDICLERNSSANKNSTCHDKKNQVKNNKLEGERSIQS